MDTKRTIRKLLFVTMWVAIGGGMLTLLIAAMGRQRSETCRDYEISISADGEKDLFLDRADVLRLLKAATHGNIKGQPKAAFNLGQMEQLLEQNPWVKSAQVYFDNRDELKVTVKERVPVARVFTSGGRSFYIDGDNRMMQLSEKVSTKLPVFTGFPEKKKLVQSDSVLINQIRETAQFISADAFWNSQVTQVDLVSCGPACWEMELAPLVGNHVVKIGNSENLQVKFDRLYLFYKQVLTKTGFDHYSSIDVRYDGQVVGTKNNNN
ncbi:MAG: FtsQ-type POTRA domain-containing protein [Chitinophagaceae bacterium]|nr:MAG: FtsQ-type POTRA domain-containing protein [Chitinophagaceae bacterium]